MPAASATHSGILTPIRALYESVTCGSWPAAAAEAPLGAAEPAEAAGFAEALAAALGLLGAALGRLANA